MWKKISLLSLCFLMFGCYSGSRLNNQNLAHLYQEESVTIRPEFKLYHNSDSTSILYYQVNSQDLLYMRSTDESYMSKAYIQIKAIKSFEDLSVFDSSNVILAHEKKDNKNEIIGGSVALKIPSGAQYLLEIVVGDLNRNLSFVYTIEVDKRNDQTRQNYALLDGEGFLKFPHNQCKANEEIEIIHSSGRGQQVFVRYYNRDFQTALPPYSIVNQEPFNFEADSTFSYTIGDKIVLGKRGFYHFQTDSNSYLGFSLFAFADGFPDLVVFNDLVQPLRYLTTNREFNDLKSSNIPKKSVDEFWLKIGNSEERARLLLRTFYHRIEDANQYFTSYVEGWKTDRGMIYAVFGPPNIIYRSSGGERWIYGQESSSLSYTFQFVKVDNPFSENDYELDRSSIYRYTWAQAVDTWRQGRVYNVNVIRRDQEQQIRRSDQNWYWN